MIITQAEFQSNMSKYLKMAKFEDINIYQDSVAIAQISKPKVKSKQEKIENMKSLFGKVSNDVTLEQARNDRIFR